MCSAAFHVSVVRREPELISIVCRGELDIATMESFEEAIESAVRLHPDHLFLDASSLSFMSLDALGYIVDLIVRCARLSIEVGLALGPPTWRAVAYLDPDESLQLLVRSDSAPPGVSRVCDKLQGRGVGPLFTRGAAPSPS